MTHRPLHKFNEQRGAMDWTAVTALMATVTALASMLMVSRMYRELRAERREVHFSVALDALSHLNDEWESADLLTTRSNAASSLLAGRASDDVDSVLRFFDRLAFLSQHGTFDAELTWHEFYWPLASYWVATEDYRTHLQADDASRWGDVDGLVQRLVAIEAHHRKKATIDVVPTKAQVRDFLLGEVNAGECSDDDEVETGRTPL